MSNKATLEKPWKEQPSSPSFLPCKGKRTSTLYRASKPTPSLFGCWLREKVLLVDYRWLVCSDSWWLVADKPSQQDKTARARFCKPTHFTTDLSNRILTMISQLPFSTFQSHFHFSNHSSIQPTLLPTLFHFIRHTAPYTIV